MELLFNPQKKYLIRLKTENASGEIIELAFTAYNIKIDEQWGIISFTDKYEKTHVFPIKNKDGELLLKQASEAKE